MELTLTQDDIDLGIRKNSHSCPFARAFRRVFPKADDIDVWLYDVSIRHGKTCVQYACDDPDLSLLLDGYDAGHKFLSPREYTFTQFNQYTIPL